jgi:magnesium transporter
MLEIYFKTIQDTEFNKIEDFRSDSWIYVKDATLDDLTLIAKETQLDLADIRDSLDKYELPRIEKIQDTILLFLRHPVEQEFGFYTQTLTIILDNHFVIAISPTRSEIIENLLSSHAQLSTTQKSKLILHILLKITQDFTSSIKKTRQAVLGYEATTEILDNHAIIVLTKNEEILNQYLTALVPVRGVLETLEQGRHITFHESEFNLLNDLMNAIRQSEDVCRVNIKSIRSLRDSYHIIFTNNVNRTIKLLTALTIIFSIPTIVASIYGMNVTLPFQNKPHAFTIIMGFTILASILSIILFTKKKWL